MSSNKKEASVRQPTVRIIPIKIESDDSVDSTQDNKVSSERIQENRSSEISTSKVDSDDDLEDPILKMAVESEKDEEEIADSPLDDGQKKCTEEKNSDSDESIPLPALEITSRDRPPFNVPEKVIVVYDRAQDDDFTNFECNGHKYPPSYMLKNALSFFLQNKLNLNESHEFALVVLNESTATWVHDFTRKVQDILTSLDELKECETEDGFDMRSVFDVINKHISLCIPHTDPIIPPPHVVRVILLYGRSYTVPFLHNSIEVSEILESPYFTFDVVMTHEPPCSSNYSNKIFKILQQIDKKGTSYSYSVHRNTAKLHEAMAKLLAHPLQRPHQNATRYSINVKN